MDRPPPRLARSAACARPRAAVAALASGLLATVLGASACTSSESASLSGSVGTSVSAPETSTPQPPQRALVVDLLERRAAALLTGDEAAYTRTVARASTPPGARQLAAYEAARSLRVARFVHGAVTITPATDGRPVRAVTDVSYRVDHLDTADRTASVAYDLVPSATGWAVAAEHPAGGRPAPPWLAMPGLRVVRTAHAVVAGTVPTARLEEHGRVVDRALPSLRRTWTGTPAQVLVLAPSTPGEARALLAPTDGAGGGGDVAATTEGPTGPEGRATGDRVVLDPAADARLTPAGRDVVLTHELAHVAVRASVAGRPALWLAEGYADHVGYARADVSTDRLLTPLTARVRAGHAPTRLPTPDELHASAPDIEVPYLAAWQAVEMLVERHGEDAVRRLVVAASTTGTEEDSEVATDRALEEVLGTSRDGVTRAWRDRLRALAR